MRFKASSFALRLTRLRSRWQKGTAQLRAISQHRVTRTSNKILLASSVLTLPLSFRSRESEPFSSEVTRLPSLKDALEEATETSRLLYFQASEMITEKSKSPAGKALLTLTATNAAVYVLWKVAPLSFMIRHFSNSVQSVRSGQVWTLLTSNFSHMGIIHLTANMYILNRFGYDVAEVLGPERFYLFYGTAGVASSLASLMLRRFRKSNSISLGASGAVVATLWLYACFFPDRRMSLFGSERTVTMQELVIAYTVFDAAGLLGSFGRIDFAAHLGGALFANSWFYIVRDKLVQEYLKRQPSQKYYTSSAYSKSRPDRIRNLDGE